jgi:glucose uptake protein
MLFPETYVAALGLTILTMICWGSWANTLKLCPGYRFQLFYWDYVLGMIAGAILWASRPAAWAKQERRSWQI